MCESDIRALRILWDVMVVKISGFENILEFEAFEVRRALEAKETLKVFCKIFYSMRVIFPKTYRCQYRYL
jgi:hypothetical protein